MPQTLRNLSDTLYDGLLHPQHWHSGLEELCKALGGAGFYHFTVRKDTREVLSSLSNHTVPRDKVAEYENHLVHLDPHIPLVFRTRMGEVMWDHEHLTPTEMGRHPVYADFLKSLGYRHTMAAPLRDDGDTREVLAVMRSHDRPPYELAHTTLAQQLLPDLQRVARLRARLRGLNQADTPPQQAWTAMQALPYAVMLVDAECRLQYVNPAAEQLLSQLLETGLLRSHLGKLECGDPIAQECLQRLVGNACTDILALPLQARVGSFWLHSTTKEAAGKTVVNVLPMPQEASGNGAALPTRMALVMASANTPQGGEARMDAKTLGTTLGLTPTETRLALLLAQGRTLKDFAVQEDISWHTARTHIKNLMRKTHVNRQTELAQLLRNMLAA